MPFICRVLLFRVTHTITKCPLSTRRIWVETRKKPYRYVFFSLMKFKFIKKMCLCLSSLIFRSCFSLSANLLVFDVVESFFFRLYFLFGHSNFTFHVKCGKFFGVSSSHLVINMPAHMNILELCVQQCCVCIYATDFKKAKIIWGFFLFLFHFNFNFSIHFFATVAAWFWVESAQKSNRSEINNWNLIFIKTERLFDMQ